MKKFDCMESLDNYIEQKYQSKIYKFHYEEVDGNSKGIYELENGKNVVVKFDNGYDDIVVIDEYEGDE